MKKQMTYSYPVICELCGKEDIRSSSQQIFCKECGKRKDIERKKNWYIKNNPNAYKEREVKSCSVCGDVFSSSFNGVPYCNKHYLKMKLYGTVNYVRKSKNTYEIVGETAKVKTSKGVEFLVDAEDIESVIKHSWCCHNGYIISRINNKIVRLQRFLLDAPTELVVDHANHNPLDNRKSNLRLCTQTDNNRNTRLSKNNSSGYHGIRITSSGKFNVRITVNLQEIHIGNFETFEKAIQARNEFERTYFGEFAPHLNPESK